MLAFYIRLSSEDRDLKTNALKNESNSVFNQRRLLQDYYDTHESLHGYKVIVFCDDGVTGTHFDRPKFDELIEMARNQEIHCISPMLLKECRAYSKSVNNQIAHSIISA